MHLKQRKNIRGIYCIGRIGHKEGSMQTSFQGRCRVLRLAFVVLLAVACLPACGLTVAQKKAVADFTSATSAVSSAASSELVKMRQEVISMNVYRIQLFGMQKDGPRLVKLEQAFTAEATIERQRAIAALESYGELLQTLVASDQSENISKSWDMLAGNLQNLPESYHKISQDKMDAIGKAVQSVGNMWTEWKKKEAVKSIVHDTGEQISHLCDLLKDDFDPSEDGKLASQFLNTTESLLRDIDVDRKNMSFEERSTAIAAFQKASENRLRREKVIQPLSVSIGKIKDANKELSNAINSTNFTEKDIVALQKDVRTLYSAVRVLANK